MKTSNKLLLAAALMISAYCVASAFALKKEYLKGDYKKRFYNMKQVKLADFDAVYADVPSTNISIEYGPEYAIWGNKDLEDIDITKKGKTLKIEMKPFAKPSNGYGYQIIVICPELKSLKLGDKLDPQRELAINNEPWNNKINGSYNEIKGFKQAAMSVEVNNATYLTLIENKLGNFNGAANWGNLTLTRINTIDSANIDIKSFCEFNIDNAAIKYPTYKFANTAKVTVTGEALHLLKK